MVEQWLILWKVRTDSSQTKNILLFKSIGCDPQKKKKLCVHACTRRRELRMLSNGLQKYQQCLDIVLIVLNPCKCTLYEEHHSAYLSTRVLIESTGPVKTAGKKNSGSDADMCQDFPYKMSFFRKISAYSFLHLPFLSAAVLTCWVNWKEDSSVVPHFMKILIFICLCTTSFLRPIIQSSFDCTVLAGFFLWEFASIVIYNKWFI